MKPFDNARLPSQPILGWVAAIPSGGALQSVTVPIPRPFQTPPHAVLVTAITGNGDVLTANPVAWTASTVTIGVTRAAGYTTAFTASVLAVGA